MRIQWLSKKIKWFFEGLLNYFEYRDIKFFSMEYIVKKY